MGTNLSYRQASQKVMEAELHSVLCVRSREWASLALDAELSEFELHVMRAHLDRCPSCARFSADLGAVVGMIRSTDPVPVVSPVTIPHRRRVSTGVARAAAVAAVVIGAVGIAGSLALPGNDRPLPVAGRQGPSDDVADRLIRSAKLANVERLRHYPRGDLGRKPAGLPI